MKAPSKKKQKKEQESLARAMERVGPWLPPIKGIIQPPCGKYGIQRPTITGNRPDLDRK